MDDKRPRSKSPLNRILGHPATIRATLSKLVASIPLAILGILAGSANSHCGVACKPIIAVKAVHVSNVQEMQRVWSAVLEVNASHCATSAGFFEIDFIREKENAPEMQFTE